MIGLFKSIKNQFPEHSIIAEESDLINNKSDFCWVIDPLDGTTNFVHSLPIFSISIALQYKNKTIIGVVYNPVYKKCFWALDNYGAYQNDTKISVSSIENLNDSLLVTGFPYKHDKAWNKSFELFQILH